MIDGNILRVACEDDVNKVSVVKPLRQTGFRLAMVDRVQSQNDFRQGR